MKKKVLFTATVDSHILHFHIPYLKLFKDKGYEVHVATNGNEKIPYCDVKHVISFDRSPYKLNNLKAIKNLKEIIDKEHFEIIHTHTPMGSVVTRLASINARKKYGTRVIYTAHGFHFFKGAPKLNWLLFYPIEKFLSKYTDCLITINKEDYELANKKFKKCKQIEYVPGVGIDEEKFNFKFIKKEQNELRESLGLKEYDFVIIYPAELNKNKNQLMIINAIEELSKKYNNIKVLLPGTDSCNGYYHNLVKEKGLENYIKFLGYRKDIPRLLKISDLAVATSHREGLPLNVMEAMYVGLPIIATDCRGQRDLVKDHVNGYLVNINDQERFNDCIEKVYLSRKEYANFGIQSKRIVKQYLLDNVLNSFKKIYFKKKVVLHLLTSNSYSGAENVACSIINITKDDYDTYYCSINGQISSILKRKNISYIPIKKMTIKEIKRVIENQRVDIIHAHDFKASLLASFFYKRCIIISHLHKNDPSMKKISIKSLLFLLESKKFNKIIGVSNSIIDEFIFNYKIKNKYITLPNLVDKEKIEKMSNEYVVNKKYDIFYFGRLSEEKNPLDFIEIIHLLNNKKIKCIMIGDGPLKEKCVELINQYSLEKNIDLIGFKENPFPYIKASKIGIMPSKYEGFGLTAVESMILNKPVLNSGVGGLKNIFKDYDYLFCNSNYEYVKMINNILSDEKQVYYCDIMDANTYKTILFSIYG